MFDSCADMIEHLHTKRAQIHLRAEKGFVVQLSASITRIVRTARVYMRLGAQQSLLASYRVTSVQIVISKKSLGSEGVNRWQKFC